MFVSLSFIVGWLEEIAAAFRFDLSVYFQIIHHLWVIAAIGLLKMNAVGAFERSLVWSGITGLC